MVAETCSDYRGVRTIEVRLFIDQLELVINHSPNNNLRNQFNHLQNRLLIVNST